MNEDFKMTDKQESTAGTPTLLFFFDVLGFSARVKEIGAGTEPDLALEQAA